MASRFELFGAVHLLTLAGLAIGGGLAVGAARRMGEARTLRGALVALLVTLIALHFVDLTGRRALRVGDVLPLHLCDMAILLAGFALITRHRPAAELLYFWTTTGTLLACVTPALGTGFPSLRYVTYFGLHGGVIWAALVLVYGLGLTPRPGGVRRAWIATNLYALMVLAVNLGLDENYLYLLRKPAGRTLLDHFGPWPIYLLVVEAIALVAFALVAQLAKLGAPSPARA